MVKKDIYHMVDIFYFLASLYFIYLLGTTPTTFFSHGVDKEWHHLHSSRVAKWSGLLELLLHPDVLIMRTSVFLYFTSDNFSWMSNTFTTSWQKLSAFWNSPIRNIHQVHILWLFSAFLTTVFYACARLFYFLVLQKVFSSH